MRALLRSTILVAALFVCPLLPASRCGATPCATSAENNSARWRTYIDWDHHFCFRYPESYAPISHPKLGCRGPKLKERKTGANVEVCVLDEKFQQAALVRRAPTGIESPPEPIQIGKNTFYYYGPGGGGVDYPDVYYFDLRGKTLAIGFDGPYENEKTPTPATKQMERKVLRSFQEF